MKIKLGNWEYENEIPEIKTKKSVKITEKKHWKREKRERILHEKCLKLAKIQSEKRLKENREKEIEEKKGKAIFCFLIFHSSSKTKVKKKNLQIQSQSFLVFSIFSHHRCCCRWRRVSIVPHPHRRFQHFSSFLFVSFQQKCPVIKWREKEKMKKKLEYGNGYFLKVENKRVK